MRRLARTQEPEADDFGGTAPSVLVIGFGRFGQIVSQYLLAEEIDVTAIDYDPEMIQAAALRLQGLLRGRHAARRVARGRPREGAADRDLRRQAEDCNRIVELIQGGVPGTKIFARSYDRGHTLQLLAKDVDYDCARR